MREFEAIWPELEGIEGWLTEGQGRVLSERAALVPAGQAIVEIGSHQGRSTIVLAFSKRPDVRLVAVDPYSDPRWGGGEDSLRVFEANLERARVRDRVVLFRGYGEEAARGWHASPIGLLYVDGAHDYPTVRREIEAWRNRLAPGAAVLFHDTFSSPGVTRAVVSALALSPDFVYVGRSRSLAVFVHRRASLLGRVVSIGRLGAAAPYFARNLAIKVSLRRGWANAARALGHRGVDFPY
jgi:predicted O-methyltransferase YrrM